jgi:hypothetical protein
MISLSVSCPRLSPLGWGKRTQKVAPLITIFFCVLVVNDEKLDTVSRHINTRIFEQGVQVRYAKNIKGILDSKKFKSDLRV